MTERPYPGDELVARVAGVRDRDWFFESGQRSVRALHAVLALADRSLEDFGRVLDFGCGCGRMLTWIDRPADGVDIDPEAIAWVQANLPHVNAQVGPALPPLPYPDDTFDLVFNHSVFSHLDEARQDAWLAELRRIIRPGGLAVLTVHGEAAFARYEHDNAVVGIDSAADRQQLQADGILFVARGTQPGFPDWYATTYHTTHYVFHHWARWLSPLAYVREGALGFQDVVLLRRPAEDEAEAYSRWAQPPTPTWSERLRGSIRRGASGT